MTETAEVLEQMLQQLADEISGNIPSVSGKTKASIEVRVQESTMGIANNIKGQILAAPYLKTLEDGRPPTKKGNAGGKTLRQQLLEWLNARNIVPKTRITKEGYQYSPTREQLSWAMAVKIHNEGNKLFRAGGKSGVISNVINPDRIDTFVAVFQSKTGRTILESVLNNLRK